MKQCIFSIKCKTTLFYNWVNSNILYVKDLYNEFGNFRSIDDFALMLLNKTNYLCEYMILKKILTHCQRNLSVERVNMLI